MATSKRKHATIRTVAKHVNLSPTTVSLALRGDDSIPEETRQRVVDAARELDYEYVARGRKGKRDDLKRLVYVVKDYGDQPVFANPFYGQILNGVDAACQEHDASLNFVVIPHDYPQSLDLPMALTDAVDGIIMASPYPRPVVDRVAETSGCPVVLIDNTFPSAPYDTVMADDYGAGYSITRYLLMLGHRQIQVVSGLARSAYLPPSFAERYRGYCAACADFDVEPQKLILVPATLDYSPENNNISSYDAWISALLEENPQTSAFIGTGDMYAVLLIKSLARMGYRIPQDYSVVGCDDHDMSRMAQPALTTVRLYQRALGQIAVSLLLDRINGSPLPPLHLSVGTDLIVRESTQALRLLRRDSAV